ncbi:nucleotide exchange factor GrpE [Candidatus Babeliales bacterium]|nr:nucleotide exchange factor GrpE [Candidatus Babeliales bacterium]
MVFKKKLKKEKEINKEKPETSGLPETSEQEVSDQERENLEPNYKELYLRTVADFQNYKRRIEQQRSSWMQQAQGDILLPILPILDDVERAIESVAKQKKTGQEEMLAGLELIQKNITKIFKDLGVKEIDCFGKFDPELHEALMQIESADHKSGDIVQVMNKGYIFHDEVLRHAKVSVAK